MTTRKYPDPSSVRHAHRQTHREIKQANPTFEVHDARVPYLPTPDSIAVSFATQSFFVTVHETDGRRVAI